MGWLWIMIAALRVVSPAPEDRWAVTLSELDHVRAEAFAAADPSRLDRVYVPGSRVLVEDRRLIRDYATRGARVVGAELRVMSCRILESSGTRVRLDVVDRLGPARVVWRDGSSRSLPHDLPSRRTVTLARTPDGWRVAGSTGSA